MRTSIIALVILTQSILSSSPLLAQGSSLKDYYFPYSTFVDGVVYKYAVKDNPREVIYWYMVAVPQESDTLLLTSIYDVDFTLVQRTTESIQAQGTTLVRYVVYRFNPQTFRTDSVVAAISDNHIYQWDSSAYPLEYRITHRQIYNRKNESLFHKRRELLAGVHQVKCMSKSISCIKFLDRYTESLRAVGLKSGITTNFSQEAYYGLELGLVEYSRADTAGNKYNYRLVDVVSAQLWFTSIRKTTISTPHKN
ncbi:MAG: hypothetical protein JW783_16550 [Bacteroidales bacterium]|nr:hypothetical protein [Bacteroidales bacterium]MBN2750751.1 hypothetical protein [Bacteroidales bacterium]